MVGKKSVRLRTKNSSASPFLKWAGGKSQLLSQFEKFFPEEFNNYLEPFAGGGAVFFYLYNKGRLRNKSILIDNNKELINTYKVIRNNVKQLISLLKKLEKSYKKRQKEFFYEVRSWDRDRQRFSKRSNVEKAARAIFLNRTCYNGLYRVNKEGYFNVPHGRYKNPTICDEENLLSVSKALKKIKVIPGDFSQCLKHSKPNDFVYFDPPYHPLSETAYFTNYTSEGFGKDEQKRLAEVFKKLDKRGVLVMLSNSSTPFIKTLYKNFYIDSVFAKRAISCKADRRGKIEELLITNYKRALF